MAKQDTKETTEEVATESISDAAKLAAETSNCWKSEGNRKALKVLNAVAKNKKA